MGGRGGKKTQYTFDWYLNVPRPFLCFHQPTWSRIFFSSFFFARFSPGVKKTGAEQHQAVSLRRYDRQPLRLIIRFVMSSMKRRKFHNYSVNTIITISKRITIALKSKNTKYWSRFWFDSVNVWGALFFVCKFCLFYHVLYHWVSTKNILYFQPFFPPTKGTEYYITAHFTPLHTMKAAKFCI